MLGSRECSGAWIGRDEPVSAEAVAYAEEVIPKITDKLYKVPNPPHPFITYHQPEEEDHVVELKLFYS